jgi:hypothetical protein
VREPAADALTLADACHQLSGVIAGPSTPTASPAGVVQAPGLRSAAKLAPGAASGRIAASAIAALRVLSFFMVAPFLRLETIPPSVADSGYAPSRCRFAIARTH